MCLVQSLIKGCLGKLSFETEVEARAQIKSIRKAGKLRNFSKMEAYKCMHCPMWHLGHARRFRVE